MSHWSSIRRTKSFQAYRAIRAKARRQIFGEPRLLDRVVLEPETKKLVDALPASKMTPWRSPVRDGKPIRSNL
jgi:hypothetical protein